MNHIAPRAGRTPAPAPTPEDLGVTAEAMAESERAADAFSRAIAQVIEGAAVVGRRWEAYPNDAVFLALTIVVPKEIRYDTGRLLDLEHEAFNRLRRDGIVIPTHMGVIYRTADDAA